MGTHPIFESDFDCLTDSMLFGEIKSESDLLSAPLVPPPIKNVIPEQVTIIEAKVEKTLIPNHYTQSIIANRPIACPLRAQSHCQIAPEEVDSDVERAVGYLLRYFQFNQADETAIDALVDMMIGFIHKMGVDLKNNGRNVDQALRRSGVCGDVFELAKWYDAE